MEDKISRSESWEMWKIHFSSIYVFWIYWVHHLNNYPCTVCSLMLLTISYLQILWYIIYFNYIYFYLCFFLPNSKFVSVNALLVTWNKMKSYWRMERWLIVARMQVRLIIYFQKYVWCNTRVTRCPLFGWHVLLYSSCNPFSRPILNILKYPPFCSDKTKKFRIGRRYVLLYF